jgi:hypothetical protein
MPFDAHAYGPEVAAILALGGNGERPMALAEPVCTSEDARARIAAAKIPETIRAGLYLYFGCWKEAHETAQDIGTREGSYWHAIVHRQGPDAGNAGYWFAQVGNHPIFADLSASAGERWNPRAFIQRCERARGTAAEGRAQELQLLEWQLLLDYCGR